MPAKSKVQQQAAGAAHSAKRGGRKKESLKGGSKDMYRSMSGGQVEEMPSTQREDLRRRKTKK